MDLHTRVDALLAEAEITPDNVPSVDYQAARSAGLGLAIFDVLTETDDPIWLTARRRFAMRLRALARDGRAIDFPRQILAAIRSLEELPP